MYHRFTEFPGADDESARQQAMRILRTAAKRFQFPADSFCSEHPLLHKELAAGASKEWCRIWLALNASEFEEYDESAPRMDAADEFFFWSCCNGRLSWDILYRSPKAAEAR